MTKYRVGIDVGSTHTDAVIIDEKPNVVSYAKTVTTPDVTTGIVNALKMVLEKSSVLKEDIKAVMFGTTHVLNAIVQRRGLGKVGVIRIGLPATRAIEPMLDWPRDLRESVSGGVYLIKGGHEYTGEEIAPLDEEGLVNALKKLYENHVDVIAVTSVFSIVNPAHEIKVKELAEKHAPGIPVVLSHEIATIGLLERENATILNAATIPVMERTINALKKALTDMGLEDVQMYFAQNDGTTALSNYIIKFPIFTTIAPISNSIRGAYVLTGIENAIVADTGGTTTNIGALVNGYPREALEITISGVRTNIRAPDITAIGLGGGSIVNIENEKITVGPVSVGYQLTTKGIAWGGDTLTATDIALAKGVMQINDGKCNPELVRKKVSPETIEMVYATMVKMLEESLDKMKTKPDPETVILVGGGSLMWPKKLKGAKEVIRPAHAQYANAVGAATALVGAIAEKAFSYEHTPREKAIEETSREAISKAVEAGAMESTVKIMEIDEVAMPYLPGNAVKIRVKAVGRMKLI
jgi:N-methylhydantoinase A/oxoprolinase/acetone carboxylase beta subunit